MSFQIVSDEWGYLSTRVGGDDRLQSYAPGDDSEQHPKVDESSDYATETVLSAFRQQYTEESIQEYDSSAATADVRQHWGSLNLFALTAHGGSRTPDIETDNLAALGWLKNVREGHLTIAGLTKLSASSGGGGGVFHQSTRTKVFVDRSDASSPWGSRDTDL